MLTIVWNPRGFHLIKVLEKGSKFKAGYYITEISESLPQWRSIEATGEIVGACGQCAPAYRQVIGSIF
jgi:hypothetical protein